MLRDKVRMDKLSKGQALKEILFCWDWETTEWTGCDTGPRKLPVYHD